MMRRSFLVTWLALVVPASASEMSGIWLREWQRGIAMQPGEQAAMSMYLWFYEWTLFDAVEPGPHNRGSYDLYREVGRDSRWAVMRSAMFELTVFAAGDGAELSLHVTNTSDHDWPEVAGIIPCFNPGPNGKDRQFGDPDQKHTWFLGRDGLMPLVTRAIHFNDRFRRRVDRFSDGGTFLFSDKWPTSPGNAYGGLIVRESADGEWVAAISWDDYLSLQGHNPWYCMHHSVRVGPLKKGESKVIRGKVYLFRGRKEDVLQRYRSRLKSVPD